MSTVSDDDYDLDDAVDILAKFAKESKETIDHLVQVYNKDIAAEQGGVAVLDFGAVNKQLKIMQEALTVLYALARKESLVAPLGAKEDDGPEVAAPEKET